MDIIIGVVYCILVCLEFWVILGCDGFKLLRSSVAVRNSKMYILFLSACNSKKKHITGVCA